MDGSSQVRCKCCLVGGIAIPRVGVTKEQGMIDDADRDMLKIKLNRVYEVAGKEDRKVIDVLLICALNKLPNEEIKERKVEEQELITSFIDPVLCPLLLKPANNHHFFWLDRKLFEDLATCPDAGAAITKERKLEKYTCFAEVKPECKRKDTLSTHPDLLKLALFGLNAIEASGTESVLLIQVIGSVITYYDCVEIKQGAKVVFEVSKIKVPLSMGDLPGFVMQLDQLKQLGEFYDLYCTKITNKGKRRSSVANIDLAKIINMHKPKSSKVSVIF